MNQFSDKLLDRVYDNHAVREKLLADTVRLAKEIFNEFERRRKG